MDKSFSASRLTLAQPAVFVFFFRSNRPTERHHPLPTLLPPESLAERAVRQMALCARLADVAVRMAEAAAAAAIAEYTSGLTARPRGAPDHASLFIRFSHAARQAILLEDRIANQRHALTKTASAPAEQHAPPAAAGERAPSPSATRLYHERLDTSLALDPNTTPDEILAILCENVGLAMDQAPPPAPSPQSQKPNPARLTSPSFNSPSFNPWDNPEPSLLARIGLETTRRR